MDFDVYLCFNEDLEKSGVPHIKGRTIGATNAAILNVENPPPTILVTKKRSQVTEASDAADSLLSTIEAEAKVEKPLHKYTWSELVECLGLDLGNIEIERRWLATFPTSVLLHVSTRNGWEGHAITQWYPKNGPRVRKSVEVINETHEWEVINKRYIFPGICVEVPFDTDDPESLFQKDDPKIVKLRLSKAGPGFKIMVDNVLDQLVFVEVEASTPDFDFVEAIRSVGINPEALVEVTGIGGLSMRGLAMARHAKMLNSETPNN